MVLSTADTIFLLLLADSTRSEEAVDEGREGGLEATFLVEKEQEEEDRLEWCCGDGGVEWRGCAVRALDELHCSASPSLDCILLVWSLGLARRFSVLIYSRPPGRA
jgi:hypothetical protein